MKTAEKRYVFLSRKGIKIVSTGRALPEREVTNDDLARHVDTNDEWIRSRSGIGSRHYCGEKESCLTLAAEAGRKALEKGRIRPESIKAVIVATSSGDYIVPSMAAMVQKELGIPEEAAAFDLGAGCTGFLMALSAARGLLLGMEADSAAVTEAGEDDAGPMALVIGSERLSTLLDYEDRATCILFGDGAGAAVVTLSDSLFCQKSWTRGNKEVLFLNGVGRDAQYIRMDGQEVFRFAVHALRQGIDEVLEEAGLTMNDIDWVLCHQANARIIRNAARQYPDSENKFLMNIEQNGNTSAASIPILLDESAEKGLFKPGMKLVFSAFGAGLTWSGLLMEWS